MISMQRYSVMDLKLLPWLFILINVYNCKKGYYTSIQTENCGIAQSSGLGVESRIVRGSNATLGEFPWMVLVHSLRLMDDNYVDHYCGGALISELFVVTAANCFLFPGFSINNTKVLAGTIDRSRDDYFTSVRSLIKHERFHSGDPKGRYFDIALLELSDSALKPQLLNESDPKSYVINTICLPEKELSVKGKETSLFSGFGETVEQPNPEERPNFMLKKAEYIIENSSNCDVRQLCAHESVHPSCFRDAGSPLIQFDGERAVLIGILATVGRESRDCGKNWQYFTRVSYFVDWIIGKIGNETKIRIQEEMSQAHPKQSKPSLFVILLVILVLGSGSLCLALYAQKKKRDSDKSIKSPTIFKNLNNP